MLPFSASSSSVEEPLSLTSLIMGSNCVRTCGMEDIQFAARKAAELFVAVRFCAIAVSVLMILYIILLIAIKLAQLELFPWRRGMQGQKGMCQLFGMARRFSGCTKSSNDSTKQHASDIHTSFAQIGAKMTNVCHSKQSGKVQDASHLSECSATKVPLSVGICQQKMPSDVFFMKKNDNNRIANISFFGSQPPASNQAFPSLNDFLAAKRIGTDGSEIRQ